MRYGILTWASRLALVSVLILSAVIFVRRSVESAPPDPANAVWLPAVTAGGSAAESPSPAPSATSNASLTPTFNKTASPTSTFVPIVTVETGTATPTVTATSVPGATATATPTAPAGVPSATPTATTGPTSTSTATPSATRTSTPTASPTPTLVAGGCPSLTLNAGATVAGETSDQYVWYDSNCRMRSASLVRSDPKGGSANQFTYTLPGGTTRTVEKSPSALAGAAGGFGYVVSHLYDERLALDNGDDDSPLGSSLDNTFRTVFAGTNHAIHEYTLNYPRWGVDPNTAQKTKYSVPVTIQWLFATGRDNPLWTVTFDLSAAPANAILADTRAPYGDMGFDGAPLGDFGDALGGVAWGEQYKFTSTTAPLTLNSAWTWNVLNSGAPYNLLWAQNTDAEMGIAGTRVNTKQDAGGYQGGEGRGHTSAEPAYRCADPGEVHVMPCTWAWPYQSVNYSFYDDMGNLVVNDSTVSKRLAWGADWGYLGQQTVNTINGNTVTGWPKVSYSVYIVLGPHSAGPTQAVAAQAAVVDGTTFTASPGTVRTQGPAGVNRADTMNYSPAGFNPVFGTWEADAAANAATLNWNVAGATPLKNPIIVLHNYTGSEVPKTVTLNGTALTPTVDFFTSYDATAQTLWLTLKNNTFTGNQQLVIAN